MRIGLSQLLVPCWFLGAMLTWCAVAENNVHLRTTSTGQYYVTYWKSEQGLPQNTVNCLLQTSDGYLWIGTQYGLARFDGSRFTDFSPLLSEVSAEDLEVKGLAEDSEGRLWLHSRSKLISFEHGVFQSQELTHLADGGRITCALPHPNGGLWLAKGRSVFHLAGNRIAARLELGRDLLIEKARPPMTINGLVQDANGRLWIRSGDTDHYPFWERLSGSQRWTVANILDDPLNRINAVCATADDELWMAKPGELLRWKAGEVTRIDASLAWGDNNVKSMTEGEPGTLWIITHGPAQLHRFTAGKFISYGRSDGLSGSDDVRCVLPDREGNVWVGTGGGGLSRMQPRQMIPLLSGSKSTRDEVYSVAAGAEGRVWMATTYGVVKYQWGNFRVFSNSLESVDGNIKRVRLVFERRSGDVLSVLDFDGLHRLSGEAFKQADYLAPLFGERRQITSLAEDAEGTLWMAGARGLAERRGNRTRLWTKQDGLSDERTFGLVCAPDGSVWVGTQSGGLNQFRKGHFKVYGVQDGLLNANIWPLRAEKDGTVWAGTPIGLNRVRNGEIRAVTTRQGLFDNLAYCLLEDQRGNYWTFGNRGIWRVKKEELHAAADGRITRVHCLSYGEKDGLPSVEGNGDQQPNATELPNGELWFPMTRGVVALNPEVIKENSVRPSVVIEEVRVDNDTVYRNGGYFLPRKFSKSGDQLRLPPGSARVVELSFTATTFVDSDKTTFQCRLIGAHPEWRDMDTRRTAVFTNLRPGAYKFEVAACNHHGFRSERVAEFAFVLQPRFYETWLFYTSASGVVAGCLGLWYNRRVRIRRRFEALRRDRAVEAERNRIARDLHDELGANLTGLAVQLDVALHQLSHPESLRNHLHSLSRAARDMVDLMREVVWSINPSCDTVESLCSYVCQYTEKFARSVGLVCRFDLPSRMPDVSLRAEARYHLLLILKEALNNIARHASATELDVGIEMLQGQMILTLADNGCGISGGQTGFGARAPAACQEALKGNGLRNMRHRIASLHGSMEVVSNPGKGTTLRFQVPVARLDPMLN